jgi:hypothetical protein
VGTAGDAGGAAAQAEKGETGRSRAEQGDARRRRKGRGRGGKLRPRREEEEGKADKRGPLVSRPSGKVKGRGAGEAGQWAGPRGGKGKRELGRTVFEWAGFWFLDPSRFSD